MFYRGGILANGAYLIWYCHNFAQRGLGDSCQLQGHELSYQFSIHFLFTLWDVQCCSCPIHAKVCRRLNRCRLANYQPLLELTVAGQYRECEAVVSWSLDLKLPTINRHFPPWGIWLILKLHTCRFRIMIFAPPTKYSERFWVIHRGGEPGRRDETRVTEL